MWYSIVGFLLIVILAAYMYFGSYKKSVTTMATGPYDLSVQTDILKGDDAAPFYNDKEGHLQAFVYLNPQLRTGGHVASVGALSGSSTGDQALCECTSADDCTGCQQKTMYATVLNLANSVFLDTIVAPDASRPSGAGMALRVRTSNKVLTTAATPGVTEVTTLKYYMETFDLPPIAYQKWCMITVSRVGRRFDVFYNDKLVFSKHTMYMPITSTMQSSGIGVISGHVKGGVSGTSKTGLLGKVSLVDVGNTRVDGKKVIQNFNTYADTRGQPAIGGTFSIKDPVFVDEVGMDAPVSESSGGVFNRVLSAISPCSGEGCFGAPVVMPASPLYTASYSYA